MIDFLSQRVFVLCIEYIFLFGHGEMNIIITTYFIHYWKFVVHNNSHTTRYEATLSGPYYSDRSCWDRRTGSFILREDKLMGITTHLSPIQFTLTSTLTHAKHELTQTLTRAQWDISNYLHSSSLLSRDSWTTFQVQGSAVAATEWMEISGLSSLFSRLYSLEME